jgi:hypothetical protein
MRAVTPASYGAMAHPPSHLSSPLLTPVDHFSNSYPVLLAPSLLLFKADLLRPSSIQSPLDPTSSRYSPANSRPSADLDTTHLQKPRSPPACYPHDPRLSPKSALQQCSLRPKVLDLEETLLDFAPHPRRFFTNNDNNKNSSLQDIRIMDQSSGANDQPIHMDCTLETPQKDANPSERLCGPYLAHGRHRHQCRPPISC